MFGVRFHLFGFTLIELMITVLVIAAVAMVGVNGLQKRLVQAGLESAAESLASDLSAARSSAILKQCPTRMIICLNANCTNVAAQNISRQSSVSGNYIGTATTAARYFATIRQTTPCSANAGQAAGVDGFANWDFETKPRSLPKGVVFSAIYSSASGSINDTNADAAWAGGATLAQSDVGNSLWFDSDSTFYIPVLSNFTADGNYIAFQVNSAFCNPATDDSCYGYFVTMSPGGEAATKPCSKGTRANNSDTCF
jgi:prepilin-type N-terminal cleavage/methylation domain-containing protein